MYTSRWFECPYFFLPFWIPMENLRVLNVDGTKLKTLWHVKSQVNRKWQYLILLCLFSIGIFLIYIETCVNILQAPLQLRELNITAPLSKIPKSIGKLKHLERIQVSSAQKIETLPKQFCDLLSLKSLELLHAFKIKSLPNSFRNLRNLEHIKLPKSYNLEILQKSFGNLVRIKYLELSSASKIKSLQDSFGNLSNLEHIDLFSATNLEHLTNSFEKF